MKTQDYYEDTVPNYLPDTFKKFFKMSSETVQVICLALSTCDELLEREPRGGREEIPLHKKVLMTLRYMASQETILEISDRFNVTEFSLLRCKEQVILLIKRLLRLVGRWARKPVNHTSWVAVVTPTDRPKSVRNRCLIELFCGVVCVVTLPF